MTIINLTAARARLDRMRKRKIEAENKHNPFEKAQIAGLILDDAIEVLDVLLAEAESNRRYIDEGDAA
jgi:hypothetical protein